MKSLFLWMAMMSIGTVVEAAEYYDYLAGTFIEITHGEVEDGCDVEFYDHASGMYHHGAVSGINEDGDVELVDYMTGRIRYLEKQ